VSDNNPPPGDPMRVSGGKPWRRSEWAGRGPATTPTSKTRPAGRTTRKEV
jgi:hypothetical protein